MQRRILRHPSRIGTFYIVQEGRQFHAVWKDEYLGAYSSPEQAIDDLAGGHTFSLSNGADTARLGLSYDIGEWERIPPGQAG